MVGSLFGRIGDGVEAPSGEGPRELLYQDALVACFVPMVSDTPIAHNAVAAQAISSLVQLLNAPTISPCLSSFLNG